MPERRGKRGNSSARGHTSDGLTADDPSRWPVSVPRALTEDPRLRLSVVVAFFLPGDFSKHFRQTARLFEHWLSVVPGAAMSWAWIGPHSSKANRLGKKTLDCCRAKLTERAAPSAYFQLGGPECRAPRRAASQYAFAIDGWGHEAHHAEMKASSSPVEAWFPWSTPLGTILDFARQAAELLDYDWANVAIDPDFAPLRGHPGFARLIGE